MGLGTIAPISSITQLIRRPTATPVEQRFGGPHPEGGTPPTEVKHGDPDASGHEGETETKVTKRPLSPAIHLRPQKFTRFEGRTTVIGQIQREGPAGFDPGDLSQPSPWKDLEFEAGGLPVQGNHIGTKVGDRNTALSSVLKLTSQAATKAKETLAQVAQLWSPKKTKEADPIPPPRLPLTSAPADEGGRNKRSKAFNILAIARRASTSKNAMKELEEGFASNTSRAAKKATRNTVCSVFREARHSSGFPPSTEKLKLLAGVLKAAKYRAASNYLGEYKLMAIEQGHEWTNQLERMLSLCKRSAGRAIGPGKKAAEVPTCEVGEYFATRAKPDARRKVPLSAELFDFGVIWMLREVELAAIQKSHIKLLFDTKVIKFTLPVSKMDQGGHSVTRVLQCLCNKSVCDVACPFFVTVRLLDRMAALGLERACVTQAGKAATKAQLIGDWKKIFGTKVSGHSARRTGALRYIRQGWAIAQVAYLGRWKSSVIYEYAMEALESLPVNSSNTFLKGVEVGGAGHEGSGTVTVDVEERLEQIKLNLLTEIEAVRADHEKVTKALDKEVEELKDRDERMGDMLPPVVQAVASKIVHYNMPMASCSPPFAWKTMCGWHYHRSDFVFVTKVEGRHLCRKCWDLAQSRRGE
eukprot:s2500_g2.t1